MTTTNNDNEPTTCECYGCGSDVDAEDTYDVGGTLRCGDCIATCERCDDIVAATDTGTVDVRVSYRMESRTWCDGCVEDHATRCESCRALVPEDETSTVGNDTWCQSCYEDNASQCDECSDVIPSSDSRYHDDRTWCQYCYENRDDDDDGDSCGESIGGYRATASRGYTPIRSESQAEYGYARRIPRGRNRDGAILYFGVEWELEAVKGRSPGSAALAARALLGSACAGVDHDGSLTNGCEAITQPLTLHGHRAAWGPVDATPMAGIAHAHDPKTCGLHVHATRDAVSDLTWAKVAQILGGRRDAAFWQAFCRRGFGEYTKSTAHKRPGEISACTGSHYDALSFLPTKTVEWRQPRGTVVIGTILGTIETYHSVIRYCTQAGWADVVRDGADGWIAWLKATPWARRDAQHAIAYLRRVGLYPVDARHPVTHPQEDESPGPHGPVEPTSETAPLHPLLALEIESFAVHCYDPGSAASSDPIRICQDATELCMRSVRHQTLTYYVSRTDPRFPTVYGAVRPSRDATPDHPAVLASLHAGFVWFPATWSETVRIGDTRIYVSDDTEHCAVWAVANAFVRLLDTDPVRPVVRLRRAVRRRVPSDPRAARRRGGVTPVGSPARQVYWDPEGIRASFDPRIMTHMPRDMIYVLRLTSQWSAYRMGSGHMLDGPDMGTHPDAGSALQWAHANLP